MLIRIRDLCDPETVVRNGKIRIKDSV
jgi:hypothetical protein